MTDLKNELTWSFSRHERLLACPRRYYFKHYGSWGGWERDAPDFVRELYRLGKLERRATWSGSILHKIIAHALDAVRAQVRDPPHAPATAAGVDRLVEEVLGWMRQDFADSRDDVARRTRSFKQHVRFLEHEQPHDAASPRWRQQWKDAAAQVEKGIRWFFASDAWATLKALPASHWIEIEDWTGRSPPPSFELRPSGGGDEPPVAIYARIDCAFREEATGRVVVIDWKTGKAESSASAHQLATYALYMRERHGVPPESLVAREINVVHGTQRDHDVSPATLEAFERLVSASMARMRSFLVDGDPRANVPKAEAEFAFAPDEAECRWCAFQSACPRTSGSL